MPQYHIFLVSLNITVNMIEPTTTIMLRLCILYLLFQCRFVAAQSSDCSMCMDIAIRAKQEGTDSEQRTKAKALLGANLYSEPQKTIYTKELNCHWDKYYGDANYRSDASPELTCSDTGFCPIAIQDARAPYEVVDITNTTIHYSSASACVIPKIILIHHTVTETVGDTIDSLNNRGLSVQYIVARNGTIYRQVNDFHRAWHAGAGSWREIIDVNSYSTGIEIVNSGTEPFNDIQMQAVMSLVATLKNRWFVKENYVIGHMEIAPARKQDPSAYFSWQKLYGYLNVYNNLFSTNLTLAEQNTVVLSNTEGDSETINRVQNNLLQLGYNYLPMTPGVLNQNALDNIQSFNRHYCQEIFIKEKKTVINQMKLNPLNQIWYALSEERTQKLLSYLLSK